jgi:glycosyltransferase involved in cell wall biosynthesis
MTAQVTIGVPVFGGERYLAETVSSIIAQTHEDWEVVFSIDGPDPVCEAICRSYLDDSRFSVSIQPERLGWVKNIAWLQQQATGEFWYYHQQDDLVVPRYLQVLISEARRNPGAAVVFCDMATFGERDSRFITSSIVGSPLVRQMGMLLDHFAGIPFRGLTRVQALRDTGGGLSSNDMDDFAAETVWAAVMATWGDLIRVPLTLYRKRYHGNNVHSEWHTWDLERRKRAWVVHCHDMLDVALRVVNGASDAWLVWYAVLIRLTASRATQYIQWSRLSNGDRAELVDRLVTHVRQMDRIRLSCQLGEPWHRIRRQSMKAVTGDDVPESTYLQTT